MNTRPEKDALEQRLRQMAESLEVPSALSPENLLHKLPERRAAPKIQLRRYSAAAAIAACLLVVVTSGMLLRNFSGSPVIHPDSSISPIEESGWAQESSEPAGSSDPAESMTSSQPLESSSLSEESQPEGNPSAESSKPEGTSSSAAASSPESAQISPDPEAEESPSETPPAAQDEPSGPPAAKVPGQNLSEAYQDIFDALSAMGPSSVLDAPAAFSLNPRAASSLAAIQGAEEAETTKASGSLLCTLETADEGARVLVYRLLGKSSSLAAELRPEAQLPVFQGLYLAYADYSGLYLQDDLLVLLGSAQYISEESDYSQNTSLSFAVFYDLSNPKAPRRISTLAQEGAFLASAVQNGRLTLFSQYPLFRQNLVADEVGSYVPALYCNGSALLADPSRIQIGQGSGSPVYSCTGLIDLKRPTEFADSLFYLGGSDGLSLQGELFCTSQITGDGKTLLALFSSEDGSLSLQGERLLDGPLLGNVFIDRKTRAIRAAVLKEDGGVELALLDSGLEELASLVIPADNGEIVSLEHTEYITYFYNETGGMTAADCSLPRRPQLLSRQEDIPSAPPSPGTAAFPYGQKGLFQAEATIQDDQPVLRLSLAQASEEPITLLLPGDIDADFFYDPESLMIESHLGLIGFSAAVYSEEGGREHTYFLLRYNKEEGLHLVGQYSLPAGDYSRGFLKNGNIYVSASGELLVIDARSGSVLTK